MTLLFAHLQWIGALFGVIAFTARPRSTFFDGWFIRVMDRMEGCSWAVIVGSIRLAGLLMPPPHRTMPQTAARSLLRRAAGAGSAQFTEHYVAISHCGFFGRGAHVPPPAPPRPARQLPHEQLAHSKVKGTWLK